MRSTAATASFIECCLASDAGCIPTTVLQHLVRWPLEYGCEQWNLQCAHWAAIKFFIPELWAAAHYRRRRRQRARCTFITKRNCFFCFYIAAQICVQSERADDLNAVYRNRSIILIFMARKQRHSTHGFIAILFSLPCFLTHIQTLNELNLDATPRVLIFSIFSCLILCSLVKRLASLF